MTTEQIVALTLGILTGMGCVIYTGLSPVEWMQEWWSSWRSRKAHRVPVQWLAPDVVEYDLLEVLGDVPALPDDEHLQWEARTMRRMQAIEAVGDRDGWECGICHAPAEHLYFVELHDDGTLCCAVCTQLLDAGALE